MKFIAKGKDSPSRKGCLQIQGHFLNPTLLVYVPNFPGFIFILFALKIPPNSGSTIPALWCVISPQPICWGHCKQGAIRVDSWTGNNYWEGCCLCIEEIKRRGWSYIYLSTKIYWRGCKRQRTSEVTELSPFYFANGKWRPRERK